MFLGSHSINMDTKGRFAVPTRIRETLASVCEGRVVITAHNEERCLLVYPEPQWQELLPKIEALPNLNKAASRLQRLLIGYACPLEMDGNGRVLLPQTLRDFAGLEKKLMLVGQGKKLELWSEEHWNKWLEASAQEDELTDEMLSLSL
ncbi:division/cell wall cluster transcriptional repressor MraZ [Aurantivibrio plasticivorans]